MAPFDHVSARRVKDEEDSFLDWDGEATLFEEDGEDDDSEDEELSADSALEEDDEDEIDDEDDDVDELDFG